MSSEPPVRRHAGAATPVGGGVSGGISGGISGALRRRPRQARAQERVERILDAAEQVFAEVGFGAATTNQIAQQAGTSIGSLYEFFPNKEALARSLADRYVAQIAPVYETLLVDEPTLLGSELVIGIIESFDRYFREHPGAVPLLNGRLTSAELLAAGEQLQAAMVSGIDRLLAVRRPDVQAEHRVTVAAIIADVIRSMLVMADSVPLSRRRVIVRETERMIIGYLTETLGEPSAELTTKPRRQPSATAKLRRQPSATARSAKT